MNSCTMVENRKKHRQNSNLINHFPTSEGVSERANEWAVRANGRASGPVLQSVFLAAFDHSGQVQLTSTKFERQTMEYFFIYIPCLLEIMFLNFLIGNK